jgi:two-component system, NarL family, sensor histidine kinase DesK
MVNPRSRAAWLSGQEPQPPADAAQDPVGYRVHGGQELARGVLLAVLCAFCLIQIIDILSTPVPTRGRDLWVGGVASAMVFAIQLLISSPRSAAWPMPRRVAMLLLQGAITYLPLLVLSAEWGGMAGFFAGSILLLIPGWTAWAAFAAVVCSMVVYPWSLGLGVFNTAYFTLSTLDIGLMVFGLSRLSLVISYLNASRAQLAQLAVVRERERFARDLHDLLGYSLSSITLKAELTKRLVDGSPARARDELAELLDIARQALADVRLVASGYRNMSLAKEAASVTPLLAMAGITATVEVDCGALDETVDTVLATVLREAVTNLLRHSTAQNCTIIAAERDHCVQLRINNDGVASTSAHHRDGGGLENLECRLTAIGGRLEVTLADGRFEVLAITPSKPLPDGAPSNGVASAAGPGLRAGVQVR